MLYDFLLTQQEKIKKTMQKKISFAHSFEKYLKSFLQESDFGEVGKFDLHTNKKAKYISIGIIYIWNRHIRVNN